MEAKKGKGIKLLSIPVLAVVFLIIANVTLGFILTKQSGAVIKSLINDRMFDIVNTAASMLDGDEAASLTADDVGSESYYRVYNTLAYFQNNFELKFIYAIAPDGNGGFVFSVDPSDDPGEFGSPVAYTDALYQASLGTPAVDEVPYTDAWGRFYSAYCPVFKSNGEVGVIVGVDFSADWYDKQITDFAITVAVVASVSLIIGIIIAAIATRKNRRQNRILNAQLNELAGKVAELVGELEKDVAIPTEDDSKLIRTAEELQSGDDVGEKIIAMQDDIKKHIELIRDRAYLDGLTGLGNKTAYLEAVKNIELLLESGAASFGIAVFDLNGLKATNDEYGHQAGDSSLKNAGRILKRVFGDGVYRVGGDEFVALIEGAAEEGIKRSFEEIERGIEEVNNNIKPGRCAMSLSKGYAMYDPETDTGFKAVFARADVAMYDDKRRYYEKHGDRRRKNISKEK